MRDRQLDIIATGDTAGQRHGPAAGSSWRRLRDWLVALVLIPLAALLLLEGGLRLARFGTPASYFEQVTLRGEPFILPRYQYFDRFFPSGLSRAPYTHGFPLEKAPGTRRIFILGESAAIGEPETHSGFGHQLESLLCDAFPETRFEVRNLAVASIDSHIIRCIAEELPRYRPDFILLYMGNNEVIGPFGANTIFHAARVARYLIRPAIMLRSLHSYQCAEALLGRLFPGIRHSWGDSDMAFFAQGQVPEDDARLESVYAAFDDNLRSIIQTAIESGAHVVVSNVGSNLRDFAPFASLHGPRLSRGDGLLWAAAVLQGDESAARGDHEQALDAYRRAAVLDSRYAELQFKTGRSLWALGRYQEAGTAFLRARDLDTLRFRADSKINTMIARAVASFTPEQAAFVDGAGALAAASAGESPGDELFYDHVHLTPEGNYHLACAFFQAISPLVAATISQRAATPPPPASMAKVLELLPVTTWNRFRQYDMLLRLVRQPPFTNQWNWRDRVQCAQEAFNAYASVPLSPHLRSEVRTRFENAVALRPGDLLLRETFAEYLFQAGDHSAAVAAASALIEQDPFYAYGAGQFVLADSLCALGRCEEAVTPYRELVAMRPGAIEPRLAWARCLRSLGRDREADAEFARCLEQARHGKDSYQSGRILEFMGRRLEALDAYRDAILASPPRAFVCDAFYRLLIQEGESAEHAAACEALARATPANAHVRYILALALVKAERLDDAQAALAEATRLDPMAVSPLVLSADLRARAGDLPGAIAYQTRAIEREPRNYALHRQLADYRRAAGDLPGAARALAAAYTRNPYERTLLDRLDETLRATGDHAFTLEVWRGLVRERPDAAPAFYGLGLALRAADTANNTEAESAFRRAIELEPGYRPPYDALIALLQERLSPEELGPAAQELWDTYRAHAPEEETQSSDEAVDTPAEEPAAP